MTYVSGSVFRLREADVEVGHGRRWLGGRDTSVPSWARADVGYTEVGGSDEGGETVMREQGVDVMRTEVGRTGDSRRGTGDGGERERHGRPVVGEGGRWVHGGERQRRGEADGGARGGGGRHAHGGGSQRRGKGRQTVVGREGHVRLSSAWRGDGSGRCAETARRGARDGSAARRRWWCRRAGARSMGWRGAGARRLLDGACGQDRGEDECMKLKCFEGVRCLRCM